jgi:hypothetical protein
MKFILSLFAIVCVVSMTHAQWKDQQPDVPAYNKTAPAKGEKLPPILTEQQLTQAGLTAPAQKASYKAAARIAGVLHQVPCYCYCDRHAGHKSLRSCFEGTHGANCSTCMAEALYSYQMTKKGWTAGQIRDGIIRGEWRQIDLENPAPVM